MMQKEVSPEASQIEDDDIPVGSAVALTVNLVRAYVANHTVPSAQLGQLLEQTHRTVLSLSGFKAEPVDNESANAAIEHDAITCLDCGKRLKTLKRHLKVHHSLSPQQYRNRWNLPPDYPMVAPEFAAKRSTIARSTGLGKKQSKGKGPHTPGN